MKILYINKALHDPMKSLARFVAQGRGTASVFMTERWPRGEQLPGVMLMRVPPAPLQRMEAGTVAGPQQSAEQMTLRAVHNAMNVMNACHCLRKGGFTPDVIYASTQDGYALNVRQVFPHARLVTRLDWLYPQNVQSQATTPERAWQSVYERLYNAFQLPLFLDCSLGITISEWQKKQLCTTLAPKIRVIANGVDSHFFTPPPTPCRNEVITFSCQGTSALRGITTICECLPKLLTLRPQSRVQILSFAARKTEASREQRYADLAALLPPLSDEQRQRVSLMISPPPAHYLSLLQQSALYVYLTAPTLLTAGLMEAMSCGTLVLASDTESVREIVTHGENGLLWNGSDAQSLAFTVAETVAKARELQPVARNARATILARHDKRTLLPQHAAVVCDGMER